MRTTQDILFNALFQPEFQQDLIYHFTIFDDGKLSIA